jgi:DNA gyrase/topoisomerase IV subunit B
LETAIQNQEVCDLISTIGMGVSQKYNINKLRYGKVIIATDADDDGQVISATIIGTILTHLSFLIPEGMLYIAESPIYIQGGKYIYPSDKQLDCTYKGLNMSKPYNHIKGLGELDPPDIKKVFFDKSTRRLIQVTPENIEKAFHDTIDNKILKPAEYIKREIEIQENAISKKRMKELIESGASETEIAALLKSDCSSSVFRYLPDIHRTFYRRMGKRFAKSLV